MNVKGNGVVNFEQYTYNLQAFKDDFNTITNRNVSANALNRRRE